MTETVKVVADPNVKDFEYKTILSSGVDLRANIDNSFTLNPGDSTLIPTGIHVELPANLDAGVRPRSGLALKHGITVLNSPGTIDADYRNEIGVILINHSKDPYTIEPQERIAQLVFQPVVRPDFVFVNMEDLSDEEERKGGFGHTGNQ